MSEKCLRIANYLIKRNNVYLQSWKLDSASMPLPCHNCSKTVLNLVRSCSTSTSSNASEKEYDKNDEPIMQSSVSKNPIVLKYQKILNEPFIHSSVNTNNVEKVYKTNFGSIRFDTDNLPPEDDGFVGSISEGVSGERENEMSVNCEEQNYIDEVYFGESSGKTDIEASFNEGNSNNFSLPVPENIPLSFKEMDRNFIDNQYFERSKSTDVGNIHQTSIPIENSTRNILSEDNNYVDQQYFKSSLSKSNKTDRTLYSFEESLIDTDINEFEVNTICNKKDDRRPIIKLEANESLDTGVYNVVDKRSNEEMDNLIQKLDQLPKLMPLRKRIDPTEYKTLKEEKRKKEIKESQETQETQPEGDEAPKNVFEFVKRQREKVREEERDDDGNLILPARYKNILKHVPNFTNFLRYEIVDILAHSIIFNQYGIVAFNKPYGLPIHGGGVSKSSHVCITDLLPDLAERLNVTELHSVHRLDMNTTGVLLFATNLELADRLRGLFKNHAVRKTYLAITKMTPSPLSGVLNIPIAEGNVDHYQRMVLRPDVKGLRARDGHSKQALTKFKVLSTNSHASLVELEPATGIKHQLRVHLAFGLDCPILGDHKYSHLKKMAPQRLPGDLLNKLSIKQSKVRDLPMYLHSWIVHLPSELRDSPDTDSKSDLVSYKPIYIKATVPKFFKQTMKYIGLSNKNSFCKDMKLEKIFDKAQDWNKKEY